MPVDFLHNHSQFADLLRIVEYETGIQAGLLEKDYWIMHSLYGLQKQGYGFELKGGTSLSKGFKIIERFSEDIDIHIKPPAELKVNENPNNTKPNTIAARKNFYDWLSDSIKIDGIVSVERDILFDDTNYYRSGGIRLHYNSHTTPIDGVKDGILLEAGFDDIAPNSKVSISSWAYDRAVQNNVNIIDNRAVDIICYDPRYTFVEKLQTIATKFRKEVETGNKDVNFMRQYYDIYCLLEQKEIQAFIGTDAYYVHKAKRFPKTDFEIPIAENQAFLLHNMEVRKSFKNRYQSSAALYYNGQPEFDVFIDRIGEYVKKL